MNSNRATPQQQVVGQEFVYEVIPGPLFGEPRVLPNSTQTPVATVIEEPEFVSFPDGGVVVMDPVVLSSDTVIVEGPHELPAGMPLDAVEGIVTGPLPLPLPPNPIVVGANDAARSIAPQSADVPRTQTQAVDQALPRQPETQRVEQDLAANERVAERVAMSMSQTGTTSLERSSFDPRQPLMSYVRMFDGTDANLVARLSDYLELSGETRTGDVSAFIRRSDFF